LTDRNDQVRTASVPGFPPCLKGYVGARDSAFKGHGIGKNSLNVGDAWRKSSRSQSKAIQIEADYGVAVPFAPQPEPLIKEIPFGKQRLEMNSWRDHLDVASQRSHTGGQGANSYVTSAAAMNALWDGGDKGEAMRQLRHKLMSASTGCSDERFNAPAKCRKAGETARTLHHPSRTLSYAELITTSLP
jgi:hypothetical protein